MLPRRQNFVLFFTLPLFSQTKTIWRELSEWDGAKQRLKFSLFFKMFVFICRLSCPIISPLLQAPLLLLHWRRTTPWLQYWPQTSFHRLPLQATYLILKIEDRSPSYRVRIKIWTSLRSLRITERQFPFLRPVPCGNERSALVSCRFGIILREQHQCFEDT